jgi:glycosyltransferase involved in cell wall biosynthesis
MRLLFPYMARWRSANWSRYHHLLTALARRGHQITVLQAPPLPGARETNYIDLDAPLPAGIEVVDLHVPAALWRPTWPLDKLAKKGLVTLAAWRTVRALARRRAVDVLLLYNVPQLVLARAFPGTLVVDLADDLLAMLEHEAGPLARPLLVPPATWAFRALVDSAQVVTVAASVMADRLDGRAVVLPNGVDLAAAARADGSAIRARYPRPLLGYVGAFEYFVDFDLVLDIAARLPACNFLLVGGGRRWAAVQAEARRRGLSNVHFTGPVPYAAALDHMAALDVALVPFTRGRVSDAISPLKLFEYLAVGTPVVSTPAEEAQRLAADWALFGSTAGEWVTLVESLLRAPDLGAQQVARAQADLAAHYQWDHLAAQLEALMEGAHARGALTRGAP